MVVVISLLQLGNTCSPERTAGPAAIETVILSVGDSIVLAPGASQQVGLTVRNVNGLSVPPAEYTATWEITNPTVATVNGDGMVTGVADGVATLRVTVRGDGEAADSVRVRVITPIDATVASVVVTPVVVEVIVGRTFQAKAEARNAAGVVLAGRTFSWRVKDPALATVTSTGLVAGLSKGDSEIYATTNGVEGRAFLEVRNPVARIEVSPDSLQLLVGTTASLERRPVDAAGAYVSATLRSSSSNPSVATIGTSGTVTAVSPGQAKIIFEADDVRVEVPVTVYTAVTALAIDPTAAGLVAGDTLRFQAQMQGGAGLTPAWSSSAPGVATVGPNGLVTAVSAGTARITVSAGGMSAHADVTVYGPITSVTISPESVLLETGRTQQFAASVVGGMNPSVTWSSSDTAVASVSSGGLVTAKAEGEADIVASAGGVADTALVIVYKPTPPPTSTDTLVLSGGSLRSLKRLQGGGIEEFSFVLAGDHDPSGDGTMQGFAAFDLSGIGTDPVASAVLRVTARDPWGDVASLGMLYVEWAQDGAALNEGALAGTAVPVRTGSNYTADVDVTQLVKDARAAGRTSIMLRFRFATLVSANNSVDYTELDAGPLTVIVVR